MGTDASFNAAVYSTAAGAMPALGVTGGFLWGQPVLSASAVIAGGGLVFGLCFAAEALLLTLAISMMLWNAMQLSMMRQVNNLKFEVALAEDYGEDLQKVNVPENTLLIRPVSDQKSKNSGQEEPYYEFSLKVEGSELYVWRVYGDDSSAFTAADNLLKRFQQRKAELSQNATDSAKGPFVLEAREVDQKKIKSCLLGPDLFAHCHARATKRAFIGAFLGLVVSAVPLLFLFSIHLSPLLIEIMIASVSIAMALILGFTTPSPLPKLPRKGQNFQQAGGEELTFPAPSDSPVIASSLARPKPSCLSSLMALFKRKFPKDIVMHTDRGSQYCAKNTG